MEKIKTAGLLLKISGILLVAGSLIGLAIVIGTCSYYSTNEVPQTDDVLGLMIIAIIMFIPIGLVFGIIQLIAGIRYSKGKNRVFSIFGCILGILTLLAAETVCLAITGILSLFALILIIQSSEEFKKRQNEQNLQ